MSGAAPRAAMSEEPALTWRRVRAWRVAIVLVCVLGWSLLGASAARADGDPASDFLLANAVFYPYSYPVSPAARRRLDAEMALAVRVGFPLRVALIGSPVDLGTASTLFGRPQAYASFLDIEIAYRPVLVVMPNGYGAAGFAGPLKRVLDGLPRPSGRSGDPLARSAMLAVATLARATAHPLPGFSGSATGNASSATVWVAAAAAICLLAVVVGTARARRGVAHDDR